MNHNPSVENLRYQDAVARVASVDLKSTARVLRALTIVAKHNHDIGLASEVEDVLLRSAMSGGVAQALDSKPDPVAVAACDKLFKRIIKKVGWDTINRIHRLSECDYEKLAEEELIQHS